MCVPLSNGNFAAESGQQNGEAGRKLAWWGPERSCGTLRGIQVVTTSLGYMLGVHQCPAECPQGSLSHFILDVKGSPRGLLSPPSRKQERANQSIRPDLLQLREGDAPAVITWLWGLWLESTPPSLASEALVLIEAHGSRPQRISADAGV